MQKKKSAKEDEGASVEWQNGKRNANRKKAHK